MADPQKLSTGEIPASLSHNMKDSVGYSCEDGQKDHRSEQSGLLNSNAVDDGDNHVGDTWYSAITNPPSQAPVAHGPQLPTPRSFGAEDVFPFFPTAVASPESPLLHARFRLLGGASNASGTSRPQARPCVMEETQHSLNATMHPQAITPRASPVASTTTLPARPLSVPNLSSSSQEPPPVFVKTESPPPVLAPAYDISLSRPSTSHDTSSEAQPIEISLSSPFIEKVKPPPSFGDTKRREPFYLQAPDSPTPSTSRPAQQIVLSSPAQIEEKPSLSNQAVATTETTSDEPSRQPGGELNRIRNHIMEVEETRKAELENRRPEYLRRMHHEEEVGSSVQAVQDRSAEKIPIGIMETPAKGRRIQLFDFQQTSAESFEESLMTHGYGTYGEARTPHRPLATTEGLSKEAMDWLAYNTPAAVPGSSQSHLVPDAELNEKELKKRKRLEVFRNSTARAYAKLYPAEVEGIGRVLLNMPPEEVGELATSPVKKRGKRKRGGAAAAAAAERRGKVLRGSTPVQTNTTEPQWLDKEIPWCLREKEREEEMKARDAERMKWIDRYFAHDTTDEDSDKNEEDGAASPPWVQESNEPPETSRPGRGKTVSLQANPGRKERAFEGRMGRSLFFPTDPADARTALMSKRSVRLLAQKKMRENGQRPASLRGYREGRLACSCGAIDEEDDGKPAVQCDDCYNWHHLECIGVQDESELGEKEDLWFCPVCTARSEAALSARDWRNQRQPTFVPTDDRPIDTTRSDVAFFSSSPLRDWASSGSLHTPVQGQGRLRTSSGGTSESFRRSIWEDQHTGPGPATPMTSSLSRGVHHVGVRTPGSSTGHAFDPLISPRTSFPKFGTSFTTPKGSAESGLGAGGSIGSGFGVLWPPPSSGNLFATPTPRGRASSGFGFGYDSSDPLNSSRATVADSMYGTDDTPIRRAPAKETRTTLGSGLGSYPSSGLPFDSPLAGRGGQSSSSKPLDGKS